MIYIRTCAYNAEKTLKRTVESILSQTEREFTYFLLDNGSTDGTGEMVRQYAKEDDRIVPFYNKVNRNYAENPDFWLISHQLKDEDYLVVLDADDWYEPTFLEEMLAFMNQYNLDMAACGTEFVLDGTNKCAERRVLNESIILVNPEDYDQKFPYIHWNLRQTWGKVFSGRVARARYEMEMPEWFPKSYGGDTMNVLVSLENAEGIGVYAKVLHHYTYSKESVSYRWMEGRKDADFILHKKTEEFLLKKAGRISVGNHIFLCGVFLHAMIDTLEVLFGAKMPQHQKLEVLERILCDEATRKVLDETRDAYRFGEVKNKFQRYRVEILEWLLDHVRTAEKEDYHYYEALFMTYNKNVFNLIPFDSFKLLISSHREIIKAVLSQNYDQMFVKLDESVKKIKSTDVRKGYLLSLAQNVAAFLSIEQTYIGYSKRWLWYLLDQGKIDVLRQELSEWIQILPRDKEIRELVTIVEGSKHEV